MLLKATKVDGVYDSDPVKNADAKRYETISFDQVLADKFVAIGNQCEITIAATMFAEGNVNVDGSRAKDR